MYFSLDVEWKKSLKNAKDDKEVKIQDFQDETKVREQTKNARKKSKYQGLSQFTLICIIH